MEYGRKAQQIGDYDFDLGLWDTWSSQFSLSSRPHGVRTTGESKKSTVYFLYWKLCLLPRWVDVLNPATNQLVTKVPQSTQQVLPNP